ncbi:MAG: HIT domain-containing protein [Actinobacteria bacterium]|nr:MAG: HIT domain-containing protein [Actinomycetota bacterium]
MRRSAPMTSSSSIDPGAATGTTIRRGSSMPRWGNSSRFGGQRFPRRGSSLPEDCLFCRLVEEGDHVAKADGFVAVRDINPRADTHLLVLPERHVPSFREVDEFPPEEAKRMLDFVAETARKAGLEDYRVVVNVGEGGGQTIFHLHWHVLGGRVQGLPN